MKIIKHIFKYLFSEQYRAEIARETRMEEHPERFKDLGASIIEYYYKNGKHILTLGRFKR